jgi:hypothetical protein
MSMLLADDIADALELRETERTVSEESLRALDWLNFFKADAQTILGPYLAIFLLAVRHWDVAAIGIAMSVPAVVTTLAQTPAGALLDWIAGKCALERCRAWDLRLAVSY